MTTDSRALPAAASTRDCLSIAINYARMLVEDIPPESFGHMPHPDMNHPAFCIGHLSLYPNFVLRLIGNADQVVEKPGWSDLFDAPNPCVEQDGRYPAKDEIMAHFFDRHQAVSEALEDVSADVLEQTNTDIFKGKIQTVGGVVNFMLASHTMLHLGQVSAWRRAIGMKSVM